MKKKFLAIVSFIALSSFVLSSCDTPVGQGAGIGAATAAISVFALGVHPRALALPPSSSVIPATAGDSFRPATCALHPTPCGNRCFDRWAHGQANRSDS